MSYIHKNLHNTYMHIYESNLPIYDEKKQNQFL
jgi:hypothetical protein